MILQHCQDVLASLLDGHRERPVRGGSGIISVERTQVFRTEPNTETECGTTLNCNVECGLGSGGGEVTTIQKVSVMVAIVA